MSPLLLGLVLTVGAPALKDKPAAQDLYGEWEFEPEPAGRAGDPVYRYRFNKNGTWEVLRGGEVAQQPRGFAFDPAARPPRIDFNTPPAGPLVLGIYRVDGDRLTICDAGPDQPRPAAFASGPGRSLVHLRRVKPGD